MERKNELRHVQLNHTRTDGALPLYLAEDCRESFFLNAFMIGKDSRKAMLEGRADYIPCGYLDQARFIRRGTYSPDYCVLHVTPPDEKGYCSLGVCASYLVAAWERSEHNSRNQSEHAAHVRGKSSCGRYPVHN